MKLSFPDQCRAAGLPAPHKEFPFASDYWQGGVIPGCDHRFVKRYRCQTCNARKRQWRFDWAWDWIAIEVQGGLFKGRKCKLCGQRSGGRHSRGAHLKNEYEKLNHAVLLGWFVVMMTPEQMDNGYAVDFIQKVFQEDER